MIQRFDFRFSILFKAASILLIVVALVLAMVSLSDESTALSRVEPPSFMAFESGPVRPLALTPSGSHLVVTNIPDNRIEVFEVTSGGGLLHVGSIPVGLEPVAVAARTDSEVWVVNHLSDSVSVVDLRTSTVIRTLLVGDEPRDIVFAGSRAFITTAHRGQHRAHGSLAGVSGAGDPEFMTPSVGRANVWVFDANNLGETLGGTPLKVVQLFGDTPRGLAVTPDGRTVYAAIFNSGNQTASAPMPLVCYGPDPTQPCDGDGITSPNGLPNGQIPGGPLPPWTNQAGANAPLVSAIVKYDNKSGIWEDEAGRNWSNAIRFHLPDLDVFAIDANTLNETASYAHVGTTLFNMVVNPANGKLYISNTEAKNEVRFEGTGEFGGSTVQGNLAQARVTVIDPNASSVTPRHLNKHIDYTIRPAPSPPLTPPNTRGGTHYSSSIDYTIRPAPTSPTSPPLTPPNTRGGTLYSSSVEGIGAQFKVPPLALGGVRGGLVTKNHSLATPLDMVISSDGATLFMAAFGSSKIGVLPTSALENDSFDPTQASANYISVSGGGPAGLVLAESINRLFVYTRFDNGISVIDPTSGQEVDHILMYNPEPTDIIDGRILLYDAFNTSSNGEASCASCHIFGDMDHLAWDLGDPDAEVTNNPISILFEHDAERNAEAYNLNGTNRVRDFHPMKGPMLTQSFRGMTNSGAMHWRGDRATGFFGDSGTDERLSFKNFIVAFEGLQGDTTPKTDLQRQADMEKFADFALALTYPPNPNRNLDNSLSASQARGADLFDGPRRMAGAPPEFDTQGQPEGATCQECHRLSPEEGYFGTGGNSTFEGLTQIVKVAHFRNLYTRIGMFGMANTWLVADEDVPGNGYQHMGDQIRGYGFNHDGIYDTIHRFTLGDIFNGTGYDSTGFQNDQERRDMEQYLIAFDSDIAPIVGQQITLDATNGAAVGERIDLLIQRAQAPFTSKILGGTVNECDLVVHSNQEGQPWAMLYNPSTEQFIPDKTAQPALTDAELRAYIVQQHIAATYMCVPPGSGQRIALDRDQDGILNGDETPVSPTATPIPTPDVGTQRWIFLPIMLR